MTRYLLAILLTITALLGSGCTASDPITDNIYVRGTLYAWDGSGYSVVSGGSTLPNQAGQAGKFLTTDGSAASWAVVDLSGYVPVTRQVNGHALSADVTVTKSDIGLGSVENTALSTWAGTTNITTVGTIGTGVWNAGAITTSGNVTISGNKIIANYVLLKDIGSSLAPSWSIRDAADSAYASIRGNIAQMNYFLVNNAGDVETANADGSYALLKARKSTVGLVEIARLTGAANPYLATGGSQQFKFYNSGVADMGGAVTVTADVSWLPTTDNTWSIGSGTNRLKLVRAVTITPGDIVFENAWRLTENETYGVILVAPDNREFRMVEVK